MKVKATQMGQYNNQRIREGEEFELLPRKYKVKGKEVTITPEQQFSEVWMERADGKTSPKASAKAKIEDESESSETELDASEQDSTKKESAKKGLFPKKSHT